MVAETDTEMPDYMVDRSTYYTQANAGANRRQATRVRAPALTWHRAFWLTPPYTPEGIPDEKYLEYDRDYKKTTIDEIVRLVWSFVYKQSRIKNSGVMKVECYPNVRRSNETQLYLLFASAIIPRPNGDELTFEWIKEDKLEPREKEIFTSDNRVVGLKFFLHLMEFTLRVELHSDYFTLTLYAEFPRYDRPELVEKFINDVKESRHYDNQQSIDAHLEVLEARYDQINSYFKNATERSARTLNNVFFHAFWRSYFLEEFLVDNKLKAKLDDEIFTEVFADFRGLIVCEHNCKVELITLAKNKELSWGNQIEEKCIILFSRHERYECTASYMLDGRAAYFTMLAPQPREIAGKKLIPLEYVLYVNHKYNDGEVNGRVNRWQLGRLVDRIHLLGTVRLAALMYMRALRHAGNTLSHLDSYINAAREAIDLEGRGGSTLQQKLDSAGLPNGRAGGREKDEKGAYTYLETGRRLFARITKEFSERMKTKSGLQQKPDSAGLPNGQAGGGEKDEKVAFTYMETAHSLFARITNEFNDQTGTNTGILYRIEQSRYYRDQFSKNLPALRLRRMEGFQKYDEFVERRLGTAFDFVDRLGRRYERATATITALDQNYLAMETNHIDSIIQKIQEGGELILLAALVPYYVVHLLAQMFQERLMPFVTVGIWATSLAFAAYRAKKSKTIGPKLGFATIPIVTVLLVAAAVFFTNHRLGDYSKFFRFWYTQSDAKQVEQGITTLENSLKDMQNQLAQQSSAQAEELNVEKDLVSIQKRSEDMQIEAMRLIKAFEELLAVERNVHRRK